MSKELTPLEAFEKIEHTICMNVNKDLLRFGLDVYDHCDCKDFDEFDKCYTTVIKALKDLDYIRNSSLYILIQESGKKLNALEIIKKYEIDYFYLKLTFNAYEDSVIGCERYNERGQDNRTAKMLPQEEYDLLKEVLL